MADFSSLKQTIQSYIKQNGNEEITGNILQDVLLAMVSTMGDGAINSLASALQDETTARQNQDATLQGNITAETTARQQADTALGGRIDGLQTAINGINTKLAEGYIYAGIATPSTNPGTISGKVFYIAVQAGTYTNFGGTAVTEGITILKYNGTSWVKEQALFTDSKPIAGSHNYAESGGIQMSESLIKGDSNAFLLFMEDNSGLFETGGNYNKQTGIPSPISGVMRSAIINAICYNEIHSNIIALSQSSAVWNTYFWNNDIYKGYSQHVSGDSEKFYLPDNTQVQSLADLGDFTHFAAAWLANIMFPHTNIFRFDNNKFSIKLNAQNNTIGVIPNNGYEYIEGYQYYLGTLRQNLAVCSTPKYLMSYYQYLLQILKDSGKFTAGRSFIFQFWSEDGKWVGSCSHYNHSDGWYYKNTATPAQESTDMSILDGTPVFFAMSWLTSESSWVKPLLISPIYSDEMKQFIQEYIDQNEGKNLNQSKYVALGDSITYGATAGNVSYADYLNGYFDFPIYSKLAVNGCTVIRGLRGEGYPYLYEQVQNVSNIDGIISVMIGVNDKIYDATLGSSAATLAKEFSQLTDNDNFADAFRYNMETLKTNNPMATIIFLIPTKATGWGSINVSEAALEPFRQVERDICEALSIPYVNTNLECGITNLCNFSTFMSDGVHPNTTGQKTIAQYLYSKFIGLKKVISF